MKGTFGLGATIDALDGELPSVVFQWDAETEILSAGMRAVEGSRGLTGSVELEDRKGSVITLGDVARITDSIEEVRSISQLDGETAISLMIRKQSGTNTVAVSDRVQDRLARIQEGLPPGVLPPSITTSTALNKTSGISSMHAGLASPEMFALVEVMPSCKRASMCCTIGLLEILMPTVRL